MVVFLVVILGILKTEEDFSLNLAPFSSRFVILACCHPLIIICDCEIFFSTIRSNSEYFQFDSPEPIFSELFILSFQFSFSKSYRWIVQVYSLVSSWSLRSHVSKSTHISSFVFQFFPVNCAFDMFIFNSNGGSCNIPLPLLSYQFICSFQILPMVRGRPSQLALFLSSFFSRRKVACQIRCLSSI